MNHWNPYAIFVPDPRTRGEEIGQSVADIAARQHGLITWRQMRDLGMAEAWISTLVRRRRLFRQYRGVYAVGHEALSREGRWMAAVLAGGSGGALSHQSAAALWRCWRGSAGLHISVPSQRRIRGVTAHEGVYLPPNEVTQERGIPVTTMARTLLDLAPSLGVARLANVVHEAAYHGLLDAGELDTIMERHGRRPGITQLRSALALERIGGTGTMSDLEDRFMKALAAAGAPEPLVGVLAEVPGRPLRPDFMWPAELVVVEVDGPGHLRPRTRDEDRERDRRLRKAGYTVVRCTAETLGPTARTVVQLLSKRLPNSAESQHTTSDSPLTVRN